MKKIVSIITLLALLLTLTAIFSSCGGGAAVPDSVVNKAVDSSEKVKWSFDNTTSKLSIVGDKTNPVPMFQTAPKSANDMPWKSVRNYVKIVEIVGVTDIPDYAFYNMFNLKNVTFGEHVTSIGKGAFAFCQTLTFADGNENKLPNGITTIGAFAFEGCISLEKIILPESVTSVGERAFASTHKLKTLVKPEALTLPENAFEIINNDRKVTVEALKPVEEAPETESTDAPAADSTETSAPASTEKPAETSANSSNKTDEKPNTTTTIIAIVIISVVLIGVIIGAVLLIRSNKKQTKDARTVRKTDEEKANGKGGKNGKNGKNGKKK